ncbi:hypothetical protein ACFOVU_19990 [Nocardiopsis sediminis]|uniref:Tetratricopeptide repeat protein n=1 Tax=Nocardiopsis sediminis TaxID=1778267 RepID=A0ABV8FT84_9ACTN
MSGTSNSSHGRVSGTLIQIGTLNGSLLAGETGGEAPREVRLVPATTSVFQNRTAELARLDSWAEAAANGGSRLWNIVAPLGLGATALALTWINRNRHLFGDAQIVMDCGGGLGEGRGRGIEEVCDRYFRRIELETEGRAAGSLTDKIELFRSLTEGRSVVLLLDDAQSAAQVRPFLSNLPGLLTIATSRHPLPGLADARPRRLTLGPMPDDAVAAMFTDILESADRAGTEPDAMAELIRLCAGIPLIAGHAAGLLYDRPELTVAELVERMAERGRLAALEDGHEDDMVRPSSVFDVSYAELSPHAADAYRALGLHPTRDFDAWLAGALFPDDPGRGEAALRELVRRGLVRADPAGRYLMDDLTYEHAGILARRLSAAEERERVRRRIADYYLHGAVAADTAMSQRWRLGPLYGSPSPCPLPDFAAARNRPEGGARRQGDPPAPGEWVAENLAAIMACMERSGRVWDGGRPEPGYNWQMGEATNAYFTANGRTDERATLLAWAEEDARACGHPDALARIRVQQGEMLLGADRVDAAEERFLAALAAAETGTEPRGQAAALEWLGITERRRGRAREALVYFDRSWPLLDPERKRSHALHHMHRADAFAVLGERDRALECYAAALACFREHARTAGRDNANEGKVLVGQAELLAAERPREARTLFEEALDLFRAAKRPYQEAKALEALGDLAADDGAAGAEYWRAALAVYERILNADAAARVRAKLDGGEGAH